VNQIIEIVDYDPRWPTTFAALRTRIADALGSLAQRIEHVGSTAVPGLSAKPIIDMDVVIAARSNLPTVIEHLQPLGYHHEGDLGVPGREAFTTPPGTPPHHLYVCASDSPQLADHLAFRDHLRAHPDAARAYADLKKSLAQRFRADRQAYSETKTTFIEHILQAATNNSSRPSTRNPD
jgi:GrpB-like predicted nucleotidyltransferase (UPF0157 family)